MLLTGVVLIMTFLLSMVDNYHSSGCSDDRGWHKQSQATAVFVGSQECCFQGGGVVLINGYGFSGVCRETQDSCRGGVSGRTVISCV